MDNPTDVLPLVQRLSLALAEANIRYCHWKSNASIARSLSGANDLDLLIDRSDASRFLEVVSSLGFRPANPPARSQLPGRVSLYGLDVEAGRIVQIDAQFQLVIGDDTTKNYRLPIESHYLAVLDHSGPLPLPKPEAEYSLFVVRMVLKHCPWDAQLSYKARLTASERGELEYLEALTDSSAVEAFRARHLSAIPAVLLEQCRGTLGREQGPLTRAMTARRLVAALEGYDRRPARADTSLKIYRRATARLMRRSPQFDLRKSVITGGIVVAVIGGDGSGKSTVVEDLVTFLGRHFAVRRFHLGKPSPTVAVRLARQVLRRVPAPVRPGVAPWEADQLTDFPGYAYLFAHLLTARERYRTHVAVRRAAGRGAVVVCDRYPLAGLETMDRPRLHGLPGIDRRRLAGWMSTRELKYYERIHRPDIVIVMRVDPGIASTRRVDQDAEFVRRRAEEILRRTWTEPDVHVIDANRPLEHVLSEVRRMVWTKM